MRSDGLQNGVNLWGVGGGGGENVLCPNPFIKSLLGASVSLHDGQSKVHLSFLLCGYSVENMHEECVTHSCVIRQD